MADITGYRSGVPDSARMARGATVTRVIGRPVSGRDSVIERMLFEDKMRLNNPVARYRALQRAARSGGGGH